MAWWLLPATIFAVWCLWVLAAATGHAVEKASLGIPREQRGGISVAPVIPIFPIAFWGAALLVDCFANPWGTPCVGGFHVLLGVVLAASLVRDWRRLRRLDKHA